MSTIDDPNEKQRIYQKYLQAFKKGVFNYIKEEALSDPGMPNKEQGILPRKYFSGGVMLWNFAMTTVAATALPSDGKDTVDVQAVIAPFEGSREPEGARAPLKKEDVLDAVVIGAGPAGLMMSQTRSKRGLDISRSKKKGSADPE